MEHWIALRRTSISSVFAGRIAPRRFLLWCAVVVAVLAASELLCRVCGLHRPVLYETTVYGYRVQPNQDLRRFGNRVFYNAFGMRSESTTALPADGVLRVLCIGDSIANGGAVTDQDDTYPYQLQRMLRAAGQRVEVLNASAPGWAVENEAGWLGYNGVFGSRLVILTLGTLDLFQERAGAETVNGHPSFPSRAPAFGLEDLVMHYVVPRIVLDSFADPGAQSGIGTLEIARELIERIPVMARAAAKDGAKLAVLFVEPPDRFESRDAVVADAKTALFSLLRAQEIAFATTRDAIRSAGGETLFRDELHPNARGNRVLAGVAAGLVERVAVPAK
jgi:lysophospholipase L1-like esterase